MTALVLLEFDASGIKQPSRSAVAAAEKLGEVHALVAGSGVDAAAEAAAKLAGVAKVLTADAPGAGSPAGGARGGVACRAGAGLFDTCWRRRRRWARTSCRGLPRCWMSQPISDIAEVVDADTFVRPIYAGNGMATVKSSDAKKVITVRAASFDPVAAEGGSAPIEAVPAFPSCRRCRNSSRPSCRRASGRS